MQTQIPPSVFSFLNRLKENNHRDWMQEHKKEYQANEKALKSFYAAIEKELNTTDQIEKVKVFRINRDIRFSNDKTPYNIHRSASFSRAGAHRRGGYYLRIEPGNSLMAGGFFNPNPEDLQRIRKEFEMDAAPIRKILSNPQFKNAFQGFNQEYRVKTAPKGFSKDDPNIDLIRLKSFFVAHPFTDQEVLATNFKENLLHHYALLRPFFDYMSDVLTTDLNGVSLLE
ncbi:MAG: TIGR02453 family protein [Flavobacteriaceae bacterium]|nr:TIGR02453 family protein [Flavobacteriaceae bacterium]|tara:strand:+ start:27880 stop:28560 length:681 start_codon:yes stop_codon:yes gene_type:complete